LSISESRKMIGDKKVLAITLARGGSKKIPKKNIIEICGKPLLQYTTDEVAKSEYIDHYVVSTDDQQIIDICNRLGVFFHRRPSNLASDTAKSSDALIETMQQPENIGFEYVVEIMCTNPLKSVEDIDACIEKLHETKSNSVTSVVRVYDHHPSRMKYIKNDMLIDFYPEVLESRRQDLTPPAYVRNGSIYAFTRETMMTHGVRLGPMTRPYIMPEERTINIDEPLDLIVATEILKEKT
jgi:CMP-N,N'-diacetyllegionaminic acid synthase